MFGYLWKRRGEPGADLAVEQPNHDLRDIPLRPLGPRPVQPIRRIREALPEANDLGDRILDDVRNKTYPCAICVDHIDMGNERDRKIWHCKKCYSVYHFTCINTWYARARRFGTDHEWKCPSCQGQQNTRPNAGCWCGNGQATYTDVRGNRPNSCNDQCQKVNVCPHGREMEPCSKVCHPGPCEKACPPTCDGVFPRPKAISQYSARIEEIRNNPVLRGRPIPWITIIMSLILLAFTGLFFFFLYKHIGWTTKHYVYHWPVYRLKSYSMGMVFAAILAGVLLLAFLFTYIHHLSKTLAETRCLAGVTPPRIEKFLFYALLMPLFLLFITLIAGASDVGWNLQMKYSCQGLDTRIHMNMAIHKTKDSSKSKDDLMPDQIVTLRSPTRSEDGPKYYQNQEIHPKSNIKEPWQYFQTFSGGDSQDGFTTINIDLERHVWELLHINDSDHQTIWSAKDFQTPTDGALPTLPTLPAVSGTLVKNGSFSHISPEDRHMVIPELELYITNMYDFVSEFEQEPFLRVFNGHDKKNKALLDMISTQWKGERQDGVVMRTASFGHGRQRLDMCIQEGEVDGLDGRMVSGINEDLLVPFAIIQAYRLRYGQTGLRDGRAILG